MDLDERLYEAAIIGKAGYVKRLLEKGARVISTRDEDGYNALHVAVREGHVKVVQVFVQAGINLNTPTKDGYTPLLLASLNGYPDIVNELLKAGVETAVANSDGYTALHISAQYGYVKVVKALLKFNAPINTATKDGFTPLLLACEMGHTDIALRLIKYRADVNLADKSGQTPLHCATSMGYSQLVSSLLKSGAEVDRPNNEGFTALHMAASLGFADSVDALLAAGANIDALSQSLYTALLEATMHGHVDIAHTLIAHGANVNLANIDGDYPAIVAAELGLISILRDIAEQTISPSNFELKNDYGLNPLLVASLNGKVEAVDYLLQQCAVQDTVTDNDERTALHLAVLHNQEDVVKLLLQKMSIKRVNMIDKNGATALFLAAQDGRFNLVQLLLQACCSPSIANAEGLTPAMIAAMKGHKEVLHYLTEPQQKLQMLRQEHLCQLQDSLDHTVPLDAPTLDSDEIIMQTGYFEAIAADVAWEFVPVETNGASSLRQSSSNITNGSLFHATGSMSGSGMNNAAGLSEQELHHQQELESLKSGYMTRVSALERQVKALQLVLMDEKDHERGEMSSVSSGSLTEDPSLSDAKEQLYQQLRGYCTNVYQTLKAPPVRTADGHVVMTKIDRVILTSLVSMMLFSTISLLLFIRFRLY
jgi:ankyrin repeat protein